MNTHSIPLTVILAKALIHRVKSPKARTSSWQRDIKGMENALKEEGPRLCFVFNYYTLMFYLCQALLLPGSGLVGKGQMSVLPPAADLDLSPYLCVLGCCWYRFMSVSGEQGILSWFELQLYT